MRALLLSAYDAQSHRYWRTGMRQMFPDWAWTELALPPRHFSWRVRGNPLYWSIAERECLQAPYDVVIATSMVDLATLRGLVPSLAAVPSLLYFHENQFEYPQSQQQHNLLEAQMVSLYAALAADAIAFNSAYNRDSFLQGCGDLLKRLPDRVPSGIPLQLKDKSHVLPVPLLPPEPILTSRDWFDTNNQTLRILWSARFEHDKGGEGLYLLLKNLERLDLNYQLAVTGQQFRNSPVVFSRIETAFSRRLVQFGYVEAVRDYAGLQREADVVLSTALHEFQGLSVMQAVAAGCVPVVPDRLAYAELYGAEYRYPSCPDDLDAEAQGAAELIVRIARQLPVVPDVSGFGVASLKHRYEEVLRNLRDSQPLPS